MASLHIPYLILKEDIAQPHMPEASSPSGARKWEEGHRQFPSFCSSPVLWLVPALPCPPGQLSGSSIPGSGCICCCLRQPQKSVLQNFCRVFTHVAGWQVASSPVLGEPQGNQLLKESKAAKWQGEGLEGQRLHFCGFIWHNRGTLVSGQIPKAGGQSN